MAGTVSNRQQVLPVPAGTEVPSASITGTGDAGLDGTVAPYTFLLDKSDPGTTVPLKGIAQDGTDSNDTNATQASAGFGIRGWLSTLVALFRAGTAKVQISGTPAVTVSGTPAVTVSGTPTVSVSGTPSVSVSALPGSVAQEGTDSSATTAVQATAGAGIRGWLSTLVSLEKAASAALTSVAAATSSTTLLAANAGRKGAIVVNDSTAALYIAYGGTASTTAYTYYVPGSANGVPYTFEMPRPHYTGIITGIWASATGSGRVTETS